MIWGGEKYHLPHKKPVVFCICIFGENTIIRMSRRLMNECHTRGALQCERARLALDRDGEAGGPRRRGTTAFETAMTWGRGRGRGGGGQKIGWIQSKQKVRVS